MLGPLYTLNAQLPKTGPEKEASFAENTGRRPRVGLVLSGGAAKGMAHVGVLKVLEEAGLQPDIITGTSMGSIIGGLYAIGYRADTLERLLLEQNWDRLLSDRIPLQKVIFEEKDFFENQLVELPYEDGKIQTPSGLIYGQQISALLSRLALPAYPFEDFSLLPIPYHCVAADIIRGEHVVLKEGYLPRAMRASMAIPTVFTPVAMDSMILIDGGLVRNFPVQEALALGADIVIGVYTGYLRAEREDLQSFSSILRQSTFLLSVRDAEEQLPLVDIYINPNLDGYGPQDFKSADSIIMRGSQSARAFLPRLKKLADSLDAMGPEREIPALAPVMEICPDTIIVDGNERFSAQEIRGRFGIEDGETVSILQLENAINLLFGTNYFEKVSYRLRQRGNETHLILDIVEKAPTQLKAAINYDNYLGAGFLFNVSSRNIFLPASRLAFTGTISDKYRFNLNYLKYVDELQRSSFLGTLELTRDEIPIFQDGRQNQAFRILEFLADFRLQRRLGKNNMIGLGVQREHLFFKPLVASQPLFRRLDYINYNAYAFWEMNTLDRNILPTRGLRLSFEYKGINNSNFDLGGWSPESPLSEDSLFSFNPYSKLSLHAKGYIPLRGGASMIVRPFAGLVLNPSNTFGDFYLVGAPEMLTRRSIPFYGLKANQMVAQVAIGMGLGYQHFLRDNLMFSINANAGFFAQPDGLATTFPEPEQFMAGFGLTAGYNSFLGPVKFTLMYPIDTDNIIPRSLRFFLTLGHRF